MIIDYAAWLNLGLRWLHLITGIAWIGSSFYFIWLDNHLRAPKEGEASGELWSVHGGGFYHQQKYMIAPAQMPADLHWFKWEAYFTWMSGFLLLCLVYYVGAKSFLIDPSKADLTIDTAIIIGLGSLIAGWFIYDLLCKSPLGKYGIWLGVIWFILLTIAAFGLNSLFTARGAYLHIGAIIGTVMAANVFFIIIPNQRKVVADLLAGKSPDPALGKQAKQRSLHNNYMTLPVLFIMLSHHYPMTYGAHRPWLVLAGMGLLGVAVRHVFNLRHAGKSSPALFIGIALLSITIIGYVSQKKVATAQDISGKNSPAVTFRQVDGIVGTHCRACHSGNPTHSVFTQAPLGFKLDTPEEIVAAAPLIKAQAVDSTIMPLGNETDMSPEDRALLGKWIDEGMPLNKSNAH